MKKRNDEVDFLKLISVLVIVTFHSGNFVGESQRLFTGRAITVEFFFVILGFLMAVSAE